MKTAAGIGQSGLHHVGHVGGRRGFGTRADAEDLAAAEEQVAEEVVGDVAGLGDDGADAGLGGLGDAVSVGGAVDDLGDDRRRHTSHPSHVTHVDPVHVKLIYMSIG